MGFSRTPAQGWRGLEVERTGPGGSHMSPRMRNSSSDPKPGHVAEAPGGPSFTILTFPPEAKPSDPTDAGRMPARPPRLPPMEGPGRDFPTCSPTPTGLICRCPLLRPPMAGVVFTCELCKLGRLKNGFCDLPSIFLDRMIRCQLEKFKY